MDFLIEFAKCNVMLVICWWLVINFLSAQFHTIFGFLNEFVNFVQLQQFGGFLIWHFWRCIDAINARDRMLKYELDVLKQLPQMILGWIPCWERIVDVHDASERADQRMH